MASSYTVTWQAYKNGPDLDEGITLTYAITAHTDGTVTDITTNTDKLPDGVSALTSIIKGKYLRMVEAFPTAGGTAPDAADVTVKDADGLDLLNDGGAELIHATAKQAVYPLMNDVSAKMLVTGALTIGIANQETNGANFTIRLYFQ